MTFKILYQRITWIYRTLKLLIFAALTLFLIYAGYIFYMAYYIKTDTPSFFGSRQHLIDVLKEKEKGNEYTFLVLGDARGNFAVEKDLIRPVKNKIDFAVILGDAADSNVSSHKYLRETMSRLDMKVPFFYVPGNNDFKEGQPKRNYLEPFSAEDFKTHYGPLLFSFTYHNDLFISVCSAGNKQLEQESIDYLKKFVPERKNYRNCFVLMHIPPPVPGFETEKFFATDKFIPLFEELKVNFVLAGHFHGYQSTLYRGVHYVITGGGGSPLDSDHSKQFYHAIELKVGNDAITRRFIYAPENLDFPDWLEIRTVLHVIPFMQKNRFIVYPISVFLFIAWLFFGWKLFNQFTGCKKK